MGKNKNWFIESTVEANEVVINDGGSSVDFRIEGLSDANLLVTDGSEDKVGIGTNIPSTKLDVSSDTLGELLTISNHNANATMPAVFDFKKSRGTKSSPTSIANADELGKISFSGYDGSNWDELAYIKVDSLVTASDTSQMTVHTDKIIVDTATLQFGTTGDYSAAVKGVFPSGVTLDGNSASDDYLITSKALYNNLTFASLSSISWASPGSFIDCVPRLDTSTTLTASNIYSNGASGNVSIGADTTDEQSEKFKLTGTSAFIGALTVGIDGTGHDVKLFGDTPGKYMLWDQSQDSLILGVSDTGVDFIAYGATANYKLHWDESADTLLAHGHVELGQQDTDIIKVHGEFKNYDDDAIFEFKASSSSRTADIFKVYDKNDASAFAVEDGGEVRLDTTKMTFTTADSKLWFSNKMYLNSSSGAAGVFWYNDQGGFSLIDGTKTVIKVTTTDKNVQISGVQDSWTSTHANGMKFVGPKVRILGAGNAVSLGLLEVNNISTSSGNLVLDSAGGTTSIIDDTTITGNLTVSGTVTGTNLMTADYMLIDTDTGGTDLGLQRVTATGGPNTASNDLWLKTVTGQGAGGGGIMTEYIYSNMANGLQLATDSALQMITLSPNHGSDGGLVNIGTNASGNNANLTVYGDFVVHGDADFSNADTVSGINLAGTTSTTFQIDDNASPAGPKLKNIAGEFAVTDKDDTGASIIAMGIKSQSGFGSGGMEIANFHSSIRLMPSTTGDSANKFVDVRGSLVVNSRAGTISSIRDNVHLGNSSHGDFSTAVSDDVVLFANTGKFWSDASANAIKTNLMDVHINAGTDYTGTFKVTSGAAGNYIYYQNGLLDIRHAGNTSNTSLNVTSGNVKLGKVSTGNTNLFVYGNSSNALIQTSGADNTTTYTGGQLMSPTVKDANYTLLATDSGRPVVIKNKTADSTYILPAAAAGLNYKFMIVERTGSFDIEIKSPSATNFFFGGVIHIKGGDNSQAYIPSDNDSNDFLTLTLAEAGTTVEMTCDGTNWFVSGYVLSESAPNFDDATGL